MKAIALLLFATMSWAQSLTPVPEEPATFAFAPRLFTARERGNPDDKSDPGYALYKEGYASILAENWSGARRAFDQLISKYPKSTYLDDARYWTAYSFKETDRKKAIELYRSFIKKYPKSSYYDDAMADLNSLQAMAGYATATGYAETLPTPEATPSPRIVIAPMRNLQRELRLELRQLHRMGLEHAAPHAVFTMPPDENLDPATRLKMDALYALG